MNQFYWKKKKKLSKAKKIKLLLLRKKKKKIALQKKEFLIFKFKDKFSNWLGEIKLNKKMNFFGLK
jgi:hypothetical protein